jgi:hypothetical protein
MTRKSHFPADRLVSNIHDSWRDPISLRQTEGDVFINPVKRHGPAPVDGATLSPIV